MAGRRGVAVAALLAVHYCCSNDTSMFAAAVGDQEIMEAAEECFPGWNLVGGECVKEIARKPLSRCHSRAMFVDGQCLVERVSRPISVCTGSQVLVGDRCEFDEQMVALSSCPKGFLFDGKECMRSQELPGVVGCPLGYTLSPGPPQACTKETKHKPSYICPPGAEVFGHDRCKQHEVVGPTKSCALGFLLHDNDKCLKVDVQNVEMKCAPGQRLEDGVCRINKKVAANAVCPPDHTFDGRECMKVSLVDPTPQCPLGFTYSDNRCIKVVEREPSFLCPMGFELIENKCSKRSSMKPTAECPEGSVSALILGKTYCEQHENASPMQACPMDYELEGDRCVRRTTGRLTVHCPLGFLPSAEGCSREHIFKPTEICTEGSTLKDGFCVFTESVPSKPACDAESTITPQGTCVRLFTAELIFNCPKGFKLQGNTCTRKSYTHAASVCPPNARIRGTECVTTETVAASASCDAGFEADPRGYCVKLDIKPPKKTCPKTHKLFNHYCVKKADTLALSGLAPLGGLEGLNPKPMKH